MSKTIQTTGQYVATGGNGIIKASLDLEKYVTPLTGVNNIVSSSATISLSTPLDMSTILNVPIRGIVLAVVNPGSNTILFKHNGNVNGMEGTHFAFFGTVTNPIVTTASTESIDLEYMIFG
jgi:hypothetical protein